MVTTRNSFINTNKTFHGMEKKKRISNDVKKKKIIKKHFGFFKYDKK